MNARQSPFRPWRAFAFLGMLALAAGCAAGPEARRGTAEEIAAGAGLVPRLYPAAPFTLAGWLRAGGSGRNGGPLVAYIEGDGYGWVTPERPSRDPTPRNPVALRLAARDPAERVLYLGRPCQYVGASVEPACGNRYWTSHRFAPEVVGALGRALDAAKRDSGAERLILAGYSGGGVLAALLAARRTDVDGLLTVAAPLDHAAWTRRHGITPLAGSLNAADAADALAGLPQLHLAGAEDRVVPPDLVRSFAARIGAPVRVVAGVDHGGDWAALWPELRAALALPAPHPRP
ncbi:alpha/beta hydrolase [Azospirillum sp. SYSU D00513]|uniref:alpha/beta fold hydrolase n=1 Tax=Azospirillum sp. SYSU D00513 TaxID=2812561 RepID=UPI001A95DCF3|nr:alpha/beta hydrolase [Azospirillum sp. SYSU D00513]